MNAEELITRFNNTAGGLIIFVAIAIIIFCALLWYYFAYFAYSLKNVGATTFYFSNIITDGHSIDFFGIV